MSDIRSELADYHWAELGPGTWIIRDDEREVIAWFVEDRCLVNAAAITSARDLYEAFTGWLYAKVGTTNLVITQAAFGRTLAELGHPSLRRGGKVYRCGIALR